VSVLALACPSSHPSAFVLALARSSSYSIVSVLVLALALTCSSFHPLAFVVVLDGVGAGGGVGIGVFIVLVGVVLVCSSVRLVGVHAGVCLFVAVGTGGGVGLVGSFVGVLVGIHVGTLVRRRVGIVGCVRAWLALMSPLVRL